VPLFYQQEINNYTKRAIRKIEEDETFFLFALVGRLHHCWSPDQQEQKFQSILFAIIICSIVNCHAFDKDDQNKNKTLPVRQHNNDKIF